MNTNTMYQIDADAASEAYAAAVRDARRYHAHGNIMRTIADCLDGAYVTKRLEDKILALVPSATRVHVCARDRADRSSWRRIMITLADAEMLDEYIPVTDGNRIDGGRLASQAVDYQNRGFYIDGALDRFAEIIGQYNAIARAYSAIRADLNVFFPAIPYAD